MKTASHTTKSSAERLRLIPGLGLVDLDKSGLPEALAGKVEVELDLFATHMSEGLLAAAVAVGLDVFSELLETNVTEVAGNKGKHNPGRRAVRHDAERSKVPLGGAGPRRARRR